MNFCKKSRICSFFERNHRNACIAFPIIANAESFHTRMSFEKILYARAQRARSLSMDDIHFGKPTQLRVIQIAIHHGKRFIHQHSTNIKLQPRCV